MNVSRVQAMRKWARRQRRAWHVGNSIFGTKERPRLSVYRSNRHFHSQLIDDAEGRTLASASTVMKGLRDQIKNGGDKKAAALVGEKLAEAAKAKGISRVIFDRNFYKFHGRVRAFAEAAAKGGLEFLVNPHKKKKEKPAKAEKGAKPGKDQKSKDKKPKGDKPKAEKPKGDKPKGESK